jgi:MFS family permease
MHNPPIPRRDFALLFTVLLVVAAGNTALQSVLPAIARVIHLPDMLVAIVFSFSALLWTFSAPFWARQSDIRGRKRLMLIGLGGFVVSMLGCGLVILAGLKGLIIPTVTFALFALLRSFFGIFGSAANPASQAYIAARTSKASRTNALSSLSSAFGLGTILGPAIAPLFVFGVLGLAGPLFAFAAIALIVLLTVRRLLPDDDPTQTTDQLHHGALSSMPTIGGSGTGATAIAANVGRRVSLSWRDKRIFPLMIFGFAIGSIQAATGQALGFLIIDRTGGDALSAQPFIAIALMAGAGATLLAQWGLIRMLQMTPGTLMRWGAGLAAAGTLGIALSRDFHSIVVAFALTSLGYGFGRPGFTAGSSLLVTPEEQGSIAGAVTSINGSCFVLAPAVGIGLYQLGPTYPYWFGAVMLLLVLAYTFANPVMRRDWGNLTHDTESEMIH